MRGGAHSTSLKCSRSATEGGVEISPVRAQLRPIVLSSTRLRGRAVAPRLSRAKDDIICET